MNNRGYFTLISVIIISVAILLAVAALGQRALMGRFLLLDINRKISADRLAEACVQVAIIAVVNDPAYQLTSPLAISVGASDDCLIYSVTDNGSKSTIITTARVKEATTNLAVIWDKNSEEIISWREIEILPVL